MTIAAIEHIVIDDTGVPRIAGSRIRVSQIAAEHVRWAWSAEAIHKQHDHLPISKIYAALAYFYDHREAIEQEWAEEDRQLEAFHGKFPSPFDKPEIRQKLDEIRTLLREER